MKSTSAATPSQNPNDEKTPQSSSTVFNLNSRRESIDSEDVCKILDSLNKAKLLDDNIFMIINNADKDKKIKIEKLIQLLEINNILSSFSIEQIEVLLNLCNSKNSTADLAMFAGILHYSDIKEYIEIVRDNSLKPDGTFSIELCEKFLNNLRQKASREQANQQERDQEKDDLYDPPRNHRSR